jgi:hypothetical protein
MLLFETFEPGREIGKSVQVLDEEVVEAWCEIFPAEREVLPTMPPGLVPAIAMRGFLEAVQPRPKGNIHGTQEFTIEALPRIGETLTTTVSCHDKQTRKGRNWVHFRAETRDDNGDLLFSGTMGIIWAA